MTRIVTVTLNPALDITANVERVVAGKKLRCSNPRLDPGGGGVNVSRALMKLGAESLPFIAVGGAIGDTLRRQLTKEGIEATWFEIAGSTRQSVVVDEQLTGAQYRFVLPGPDWTAKAWQESLAVIRNLLSSGDLVVGSGSLPPGVPDDYYVRLSEIAKDSRARILLDTSGRALAAIAATAAWPAAVVLMDEEETCQLLGEPAPEEPAIRAIGRDLVARGVAEIAVFTLGARGAIAVTKDGGWRVAPPVVKVVSKVGAGDSFMAGLALGCRQGWPFDQTITYAMAAAASAVTTPATELCTKTGTDKFRADVTCAPL